MWTRKDLWTYHYRRWLSTKYVTEMDVRNFLMVLLHEVSTNGNYAMQDDMMLLPKKKGKVEMLGLE